MSGEFWTFLGVLVTAVGGLIGVIYSTNKKAKAEQIELLTSSIAEIKNEQKDFLKETREDVSHMQDAYAEKITEVNMSIQEIRGQLQQSYSETNMRLDFMTQEFKNMKEEVKEHNNFAKRMPVVEEQIKVANHRIEDLERSVRT